jgi:hypothetical protein
VVPEADYSSNYSHYFVVGLMVVLMVLFFEEQVDLFSKKILARTLNLKLIKM